MQIAEGFCGQTSMPWRHRLRNWLSRLRRNCTVAWVSLGSVWHHCQQHQLWSGARWPRRNNYIAWTRQFLVSLNDNFCSLSRCLKHTTSQWFGRRAWRCVYWKVFTVSTDEAVHFIESSTWPLSSKFYRVVCFRQRDKLQKLSFRLTRNCRVPHMQYNYKQSSLNKLEKNFI